MHALHRNLDARSLLSSVLQHQNITSSAPALRLRERRPDGSERTSGCVRETNIINVNKTVATRIDFFAIIPNGEFVRKLYSRIISRETPT